MPCLDRPATRVPGQSFKRLDKRGRWHRTQEHPFKGFNAGRGSILDCVNRKDVGLRQAARARLGRPQSYRRAAQRQARRALREVASGWYQQISVAKGRGGLDGFPKISLGMAGPAIPGRTDQPVHAGGTLGCNQFVQVALTVAYTDKPRLGTTCLERGELLDSLQPIDAFFLADQTGL